MQPDALMIDQGQNPEFFPLQKMQIKSHKGLHGTCPNGQVCQLSNSVFVRMSASQTHPFIFPEELKNALQNYQL